MDRGGGTSEDDAGDTGAHFGFPGVGRVRRRAPREAGWHGVSVGVEGRGSVGGVAHIGSGRRICGDGGEPAVSRRTRSGENSRNYRGGCPEEVRRAMFCGAGERDVALELAHAGRPDDRGGRVQPVAPQAVCIGRRAGAVDLTARYKIFTARAASNATVVNEINACTIISAFAHRDSTGVSAGDSAVLVLSLIHI